MKCLLFMLLLMSASAMADETCSTSLFEYRITRRFIEANYGDQQVRLPADEVRGLSLQNSRENFLELVEQLSLSEQEAKPLVRFTLLLADERSKTSSLMYVKGYDQSHTLVARFMLNDSIPERCL